jgi:small-conductance mechanosensitive channel
MPFRSGLVERLTAFSDQGWFRWTICLSIVVLGTAALVAVRAIVYRRLARLAPLTENRVDDVMAVLVRRTSTLSFVALSTLVALAAVDIAPSIERMSRVAALIVCLVQAGVWASAGLRMAVELRFAGVTGEGDDPTRRTAAQMLALGARGGVWVLVFLVALDNLGVDVTALVAGLGVGGVAVALATQNILGDLFASVSILLDKPFVPGDFIIVGDFMGSVEHIGIKTTRVRSLGGEQIVFANNDLLQSRLRNYKRMLERRVQFRVGVVYQTGIEQLVAIPEMLRKIVQDQPGTRFDRAHFAAYGDFALSFEVVYYVLSPDYNRYMDVQQAINLDILRGFQAHAIEFALPTQILRLQEGAGSAPRRTAGEFQPKPGG